MGCEARLVGPEAPDRGDLQIRSPQLMAGYLDDPAATAARFDGEWLRTGDVMTRDAMGVFRLEGRSDLMIKAASTDRIHPEEIESVLEQHDAVEQVAVCGATAPNGTDQVVAMVVMRQSGEDPQMAKRLARYVEQRLGKARTPDRILFVAALPRLAGGKIARARLPELLS